MKKVKVRRLVKIIGLGIGIIAVLLFAFQQFLNIYVPSLVRDQFNHLVVEGSDSLYTCSIGNISVNLIQGSVKIENFDISIDSVRYKKMEKEKKLPPLIFKMSLKKGMINGLKLYPFVFFKKTYIHSITADNANISFSRKNVKLRSKPRPTPSDQQLWKIIQPHVKGIYIDRILLNNINLSYKSEEKNKYINFSYDNCSASFRNIRIDSTGTKNAGRILFTEELSVRITGVKYLSQDSIYFLKIDTFTYCSFLKKLRVQGLSIHPTLSPEEITKRNGMQVDVYDIDLPELRINNFKVEKIIYNNEINMDTVLVQKPSIKIHRDRTAHFDTTSQFGKFPLELLASAPVNLRVPVVIIDDAEVHYLEKQKLSHLVGDAGFYHVSGIVLNITNFKDDIMHNGHCEVLLKGFFMKNAKMQVHVDFDLRSEDGNYSVQVDLGHMEASELNELVVPFVNVRMKSMVIHEGHFNLIGNKTGTVGNVKMRYENLNMEVLRVDPKTREVKPNNFVSFMAHIIAVRKNNLAGKNEIIAKDVSIVRKTRQPFSHIILETFVEGAKKVMIKVRVNQIKVEM